MYTVFLSILSTFACVFANIQHEVLKQECS